MAEGKKTILAVDDTPASLKIVHSALKDEFFVHLAKSGSLAMAALENTQVDLILLDIEMPGISGFDVMELLQKRPKLRAIPVIFVTSHATEDFVAEAVRRGARDYIVKPFAPDVLRDKAYKALAGKDTAVSKAAAGGV
jgi:putative two-component system response regulator